MDTLNDVQSTQIQELRWYVVNTKVNHEKHAERNIAHSGVECYLPLLRERRIVRNQIITTINPLFPGYMFVRIDLAQHYRTVNYARGVRKIVGFGSRPVEVDSAMIDSIRSKVTSSETDMLQRPEKLGHGQRVHIQGGPLSGLEAVFVGGMPGRQRAMVLLHTLALQARVVIEVDKLVPYVAA
jgi:transcriptional antiterminator RfaH